MATTACPIFGVSVACSAPGACPLISASGACSVSGPCPVTSTCPVWGTCPVTYPWTNLCDIGTYQRDVVKWKAKTPRQSGVYRIITPVPKMPLMFNDTLPPDATQSPYLKADLEAKYSAQTKMSPADAVVLYIGQSNNLSRRIFQYMLNFGHKGGRALWQIRQPERDQLIIQYCLCNDPKEMEKQLIDRFKENKKKACHRSAHLEPLLNQQ